MISLATIEAKLGAIAIGIVILALYGIGSYEYGKHVGKLVIIATDAKALSTAIIKNDDLKKQLEKDHENAVTALNTVLSAPIPRVRLPSCPDQARSATGSKPAEQPARILPTETESILAADRQRTWGIIGEAEKELSDCRVVKKWAESQVQ